MQRFLKIQNNSIKNHVTYSIEIYQINILYLDVN